LQLLRRASSSFLRTGAVGNSILDHAVIGTAMTNEPALPIAAYVVTG